MKEYIREGGGFSTTRFTVWNYEVESTAELQKLLWNCKIFRECETLDELAVRDDASLHTDLCYSPVIIFKGDPKPYKTICRCRRGDRIIELEEMFGRPIAEAHLPHLVRRTDSFIREDHDEECLDLVYQTWFVPWEQQIFWEGSEYNTIICPCREKQRVDRDLAEQAFARSMQKVVSYQPRRSRGERAVAEALTKAGIEFVEQWSHDELKDKSYLFFDFFLPESNTLIEFDGEQHRRPVNFGGMDDIAALAAFKGVQRRDRIKTDWANDNGYSLIRIDEVNRVKPQIQQLARKLKAQRLRTGGPSLLEEKTA